MFFSDGHWNASIVEKTGDGNFMTQGVTSRLWEEKESGADREGYGISVALRE